MPFSRGLALRPPLSFRKRTKACDCVRKAKKKAWSQAARSVEGSAQLIQELTAKLSKKTEPTKKNEKGSVLVYRYTKEGNINKLRHNSMYGYENKRNSLVYRYTRTAPKIQTRIV